MDEYSQDLSGLWRFGFGDTQTTIRVPGFWEAQGHLNLDGKAWYEFDLEVSEPSPYATLEFDAVADMCRVSFNTELVGANEVGFTPFSIDLSGRLEEGANLIRVEIDDPAEGTDLHMQTVQGKQGWNRNTFPSPPSVYLTYGGIWQPVRLVEHGPIYVADVWCDMDPTEPTVFVQVSNRADSALDAAVEIEAFGAVQTVPVKLKAGEDEVVEAVFAGRGFARWAPESPWLHPVKATAWASGDPDDDHSRSITTGLRRIERTESEIVVDGRPYRMRSALHQGFWPDGLYAADTNLIQRDIALALGAGFNTLRTHLKAFEPAWLHAADQAGMWLHCDLPIGEPVDPAQVSPDSDYGRRCLLAASAQVRRDRSRPSILLWTLTNEFGLSHPDMLESDGYKALIRALSETVGELDPTRPCIENDMIADPEKLVAWDIRSPHWYGRATDKFLNFVSTELDSASEVKSPLYVTEFGEWGLPPAEGGNRFWDNDAEMISLVTDAGWTGGYDAFAAATQRFQGWADRVQAERMRTSPVTKGFCLTEWTDVPHELNGLVTLRRTPKQQAIDAFAPALREVAPLVKVNRWAYSSDEPIDLDLFVSNWSNDSVNPADVLVDLSASTSRTRMEQSLAPGQVARLEPVRLAACEEGRHELSVTVGPVRACWPFAVADAARLPDVDVSGSEEFRNALGVSEALTDPTRVLVVEEDSLTEESARFVLEQATTGRRVVVLAQSAAVPGFDAPVALVKGWGPTPFVFATGDMEVFGPRDVLGPAVFHCAPTEILAGVQGPVGVLVPPPTSLWGAAVAVRNVGTGRIVVCQLRIGAGLAAGNGFDQAVLSELVEIAAD